MFDAPYFSQTLEAQKKPSKLKFAAPNQLEKRQKPWMKRLNFMNCEETSEVKLPAIVMVARDINIDSYRFMSLQVHLIFREAVNFTPTRPGMIIRTFRSGLFGLTRRMVMAIPLSLQYGNLSQAAYPSEKRPLIQDNHQIKYSSYM